MSYLDFDKCSSCDPQCGFCYGPKSQECFTCTSIRQDDNCMSECNKDNYYLDIISRTCQESFVKYCKKAVKKNECQECQPFFELSQSKDSCTLNENNEQKISIINEISGEIEKLDKCPNQYELNMKNQCILEDSLQRIDQIEAIKSQCFVNDFGEIKGFKSSQNTITIYSMMEIKTFDLQLNLIWSFFSEIQYIDVQQINEQIYVLYNQKVLSLDTITLQIISQIEFPQNYINRISHFLILSQLYQIVILQKLNDDKECNIYYYYIYLKQKGNQNHSNKQICFVQTEYFFQIQIVILYDIVKGETISKIQNKLIVINYQYYKNFIVLTESNIIEVFYFNNQQIITKISELTINQININAMFKTFQVDYNNKNFQFYCNVFYYGQIELNLAFSSSNIKERTVQNTIYDCLIVDDKNQFIIVSDYIYVFSFKDMIDKQLNDPGFQPIAKIEFHFKSGKIFYFDKFYYYFQNEIKNQQVNILDINFANVGSITLDQGYPSLFFDICNEQIKDSKTRCKIDSTQKQFFLSSEMNIFEIQQMKLSSQAFENCAFTIDQVFEFDISQYLSYSKEQLTENEYYLYQNNLNSVFIMIQNKEKILFNKQISDTDDWVFSIIQIPKQIKIQIKTDQNILQIFGLYGKSVSGQQSRQLNIYFNIKNLSFVLIEDFYQINYYSENYFLAKLNDNDTEWSLYLFQGKNKSLLIKAGNDFLIEESKDYIVFYNYNQSNADNFIELIQLSDIQNPLPKLKVNLQSHTFVFKLFSLNQLILLRSQLTQIYELDSNKFNLKEEIMNSLEGKLTLSFINQEINILLVCEEINQVTKQIISLMKYYSYDKYFKKYTETIDKNVYATFTSFKNNIQTIAIILKQQSNHFQLFQFYKIQILTNLFQIQKAKIYTLTYYTINQNLQINQIKQIYIYQEDSFLDKIKEQNQDWIKSQNNKFIDLEVPNKYIRIESEENQDSSNELVVNELTFLNNQIRPTINNKMNFQSLILLKDEYIVFMDLKTKTIGLVRSLKLLVIDYISMNILKTIELNEQRSLGQQQYRALNELYSLFIFIDMNQYYLLNLNNLDIQPASKVTFSCGQDSCDFITSQYKPLLFLNYLGVYNFVDDIFQEIGSISFISLVSTQFLIETQDYMFRFITGINDIRSYLNIDVYQTWPFKEVLQKSFESSNGLDVFQYYNRYIYCFKQKSLVFLQFHDYENIIYFDQAIISELNPQPSYFCKEQDTLFILYQNKIEGYNFPIFTGQKPYFIHSIDSYELKGCTRNQIIIQKPFGELYNLIVLQISTNTIIKTISIDFYLIGYSSQYNENLNIIQFNNIIFSLEKDSTFYYHMTLYIAPIQNYDKDIQSIITWTYEDNKFEILDLKQFFPLNKKKQTYFKNLISFKEEQKNSFIGQNIKIHFNQNSQSFILYNYSNRNYKKIYYNQYLLKKNRIALLLNNIYFIDCTKMQNICQNNEYTHYYVSYFNRLIVVVFNDLQIIYEYNLENDFENYIQNTIEEGFIVYGINNGHILRIQFTLDSLNPIKKDTFDFDSQTNGNIKYFKVIQKRIYIITDQNRLISRPFFPIDQQWIQSNVLLEININFIDLVQDEAFSFIIVGTKLTFQLFDSMQLNKISSYDKIQGGISTLIYNKDIKLLFIIDKVYLRIFDLTNIKNSANQDMIAQQQLLIVNSGDIIIKYLGNEVYLVQQNQYIKLFQLKNHQLHLILYLPYLKFIKIQSTEYFEIKNNKFIAVVDAYGLFVYEIIYPGQARIIFQQEYELFQYFEITVDYSESEYQIYMMIQGFDIWNVINMKIYLKNLSKNMQLSLDNKVKAYIEIFLEKDEKYQIKQLIDIAKKSQPQQIVFILQEEGQTINIPAIEYSVLKNVSIIYDLKGLKVNIKSQKQNVFGLNNLKELKIINGIISFEILEINFNKFIVFQNFQKITFDNVSIKQDIKFINNKQVEIKNIQIKDKEIQFYLKNEKFTTEMTKVSMENIELYQQNIIKPLIIVENIDNIDIENLQISFSHDILMFRRTLQDINNETHNFITLFNTKIISIKNIKMNYNIFNIGFLTVYNSEEIFVESVKIFNLNLNSDLTFIKLNNIQKLVTFQNLEITNSIISNLIYYNTIISQTTDDYLIKNFNIQSQMKLISFKLDNVTSILQKNSNLITLIGGKHDITSSEINNLQSYTNMLLAQQIEFIQIENMSIFNSTDITVVINLEQGQYFIGSNIKIDNCYDISSYIKATSIIVQLTQILVNQKNIEGRNYTQLYESAIVLTNIQKDKNGFGPQIIQSKFQGIQGNGSYGNAIKIINVDKILLLKVQIVNNTDATYGGAIYAKNSSILIRDVKIFNNSALLSGGGIYLFESQLAIHEFPDSQDIQTSEVSQNTALIGGGMRFFCIEKPKILEKNKSIFKNNFAYLYGQDVTTYPFRFEIIDQLNTFSQVISSAEAIKQEFRIIWFDNEENKVKFSSDRLDYIKKTYNTIQNKEDIQKIEQEIQKYQEITLSSPSNGTQSTQPTQFERQKSIQIKATIKNENKNQILFFQVAILKIPQEKDVYFELQFDFNFMDDYKIDNSNTTIKANFRNCYVGEVMNKTNGLIECYQCPEQTYSLVQPKDDNKTCNQCPSQAQKCQGSNIWPREGYWNERGTSDILYCAKAPFKCAGNLNRSFNSTEQCIEGSIGPRCESCDYKGQIWKQGKYGKISEESCTNCQNQTLSQAQLTKLILTTILVGLYQAVLAIRVYQHSTNQIKAIYLNKAGVFNMSSSLQKKYSSVLIKCFISYIQVASILSEYDFKISKNVFDVFDFQGQPLKLNQFTLDCVFIFYQWTEKLDIVYIRVFWNILNSLIYFIISFLAVLVFCKIDSKGKHFVLSLKRMLSSLVCYFYYIIYPNMVILLTKVLICEKIGSNQYILADTQYECYSERHLGISLGFILPLLIVLIFIVPCAIYLKLKSQQNNLQEVNLFLKLNFFYAEYKPKYYYWEIVKMFYKSSIYICLSYFSDDKYSKGASICIIMLLYIRMAYELKPFQRNSLNFLDCFSNIILLISLQVGFINFETGSMDLKQLLYGLIVFIQIYFIVEFIRAISIEKIVYNDQSPTFKIINLIKKLSPKLHKQLYVYVQSSYRAQKAWKKVQQVIVKKKCKVNYCNKAFADEKLSETFIIDNDMSEYGIFYEIKLNFIVKYQNLFYKKVKINKCMIMLNKAHPNLRKCIQFILNLYKINTIKLINRFDSKEIIQSDQQFVNSQQQTYRSGIDSYLFQNKPSQNFAIPQKQITQKKNNKVFQDQIRTSRKDAYIQGRHLGQTMYYLFYQIILNNLFTFSKRIQLTDEDQDQNYGLFSYKSDREGEQINSPTSKSHRGEEEQITSPKQSEMDTLNNLFKK